MMHSQKTRRYPLRRRSRNAAAGVENNLALAVVPTSSTPPQAPALARLTLNPPSHRRFRKRVVDTVHCGTQQQVIHPLCDLIVAYAFDMRVLVMYKYRLLQTWTGLNGWTKPIWECHLPDKMRVVGRSDNSLVLHNCKSTRVPTAWKRGAFRQMPEYEYRVDEELLHIPFHAAVVRGMASGTHCVVQTGRVALWLDIQQGIVFESSTEMVTQRGRARTSIIHSLTVSEKSNNEGHSGRVAARSPCTHDCCMQVTVAPFHLPSLSSVLSPHENITVRQQRHSLCIPSILATPRDDQRVTLTWEATTRVEHIQVIPMGVDTTATTTTTKTTVRLLFAFCSDQTGVSILSIAQDGTDNSRVVAQFKPPPTFSLFDRYAGPYMGRGIWHPRLKQFWFLGGDRIAKDNQPHGGWRCLPVDDDEPYTKWSWHLLPPFQQPRFAPEVVYHGEEIWVMGGDVRSAIPVPHEINDVCRPHTVESFHEPTQQWRVVPNMRVVGAPSLAFAL